MQALVKTAPGPGNLGLRDWPVPEVGDDDVLMKVAFCGVCGSDLHMQTGVHTCEPPVVLGHEFSGTVAKVGRGVTEFKEGDPVCYWKGWGPFPGVWSDGGFAEYMRAPAKGIAKLPEGISLQDATQFETAIVPLALVRDTVQLQPGEAVVVSGPGEVGLLAANVAKLEGASHVTVFGGPGDEKARLPKALEMGADEALPMTEENLAKVSGDHAPPCWIEASGAAPAIEAAVRCIAPRGRISVSGLGSGPWNVDMAKVSYESVTIRGCWGGNLSYMPEVVELMRAGKLRVDMTISEVMPLSQWQAAFAKLRAKEALKILLDPSR